MWLQILSYTLTYVIKILYFRIPRNTLCCPPKFAWTVLNCSLKYCIFPKAFEDNNLCKIWGADRVYYGRLQKSQLTNRPFSHDVTSAIFVFQNNERRPGWWPKPVLWEMNLFIYFVPTNLHNCWPRERKHSALSLQPRDKAAMLVVDTIEFFSSNLQENGV